MTSPPPGPISADSRSATGAGKATSRAAAKLPPGAARSRSRTPLIAAGIMPWPVSCHQGTTTVPSPAQAGTPGQYPGAPRPVQVRVVPLAMLMTSTLPYSGPGGNSCTRDSASILPSGDSAAPITGTPLLSKFSWRSFPGRPPGETVSRNKVASATPGRSPPRETTITKCRPSVLAKGSPPTGDRAFPAGTGIAAEPVTCPSPEARTTTSRPATTT